MSLRSSRRAVSRLCTDRFAGQSQLRLFLAVDHQAFSQLSELAQTHRTPQAAIESGDIEQIRHELAEHIHSKVPDSVPAGESGALEAS